MKKLLIFDFDGTLCDTGPGITSAVNATLDELRLPRLSQKQVQSFVGLGLEKLLGQLNLDKVKNLDIKLVGAIFRKHYELVFREESHIYPGILDFLKTTRHDLAVASNKDIYYLEELLSLPPWSKISWVKILGGNSLTTKKPEPEMIFEILKHSDYKPEQTVIIGDGHPDILVAKRTGIKSIAVSFGYSNVEELMRLGADAKIDSFYELPQILEQVF